MGNASSLKYHVETAEKTGVIALSRSNLRQIPKDLLQICHQLRTLDLSNNRLQQLGENIQSFKNLKTLNLSHNKIHFIVAEVGQLLKLETLLLENNLLEVLPNELEKLQSIRTLNLSCNKFKIFPKQVCYLKNLQLLDLSHNEIEVIPDEIGQSNAIEINLNNNKVKRINDSLVNCLKLKIFRLDNNQLDLTTITKSILANSKICLLSVENNNFTLKQLQERDGYEQYSDRYTSTKRKMI